jgi:hypothetical protein
MILNLFYATFLCYLIGLLIGEVIYRAKRKKS